MGPIIEGLPHAPAEKALIRAAFLDWCKDGVIRLDPLTAGHSGASVYKADVKPGKKSTIQSGIYILKIGTESPWGDQSEYSAHERAVERNPEFAQQHIAPLVASYEPQHEPGNRLYAMLYGAAGGSLTRFAPTDTPEDGAFALCAPAVIDDLLSNWSDSEFGDYATVEYILESLCSYRLLKEDAPELHKLIEEVCPSTHFFRGGGGEVLVNPMALLDASRHGSLSSSSVLWGLSHGDLHGGNLLLHRLAPRKYPFYLIDLALSRILPVGYDVAYLEVAHGLAALGDHDPNLLIGAIRRAENPHGDTPLPGRAAWTQQLISQLREAAATWRDTHHPHRIDEIDRQFALCRIAAGLNWANKPLSKSRQVAALCYAAWATREFIRLHEPSFWESLVSQTTDVRREEDKDDDELWRELWHSVGGFDAENAKFILVSERLGESPFLRALGQLPWAAVIDLDPNSDEDGLYREAGSLLSTRRSMHLFTGTPPSVDPKRGTGWMMASGWNAKSEYYPDYHEWRYERLPAIRAFVRTLSESVSPEPLHTIVLPGMTLDPAAPGARIGSVVTVIDEASRGRAVVHVLGNRAFTETAKHIEHVPIEPLAFVERVAEAFGTAFSASEAQVPGPNSTNRTIPLELLRAMQENFWVLHSAILEDQFGGSDAASEFWRGRPPTWSELHAGVDIERDLNPSLKRSISERLDAHRIQTVVLEHSPGAGGTTAALRAAWDLRTRYPVVVLHRYSVALQERLRELFELTERPVLLVAESSELTENSREELYRYLSQHNCRVVLLYLRRTLARHNGDALSLVGHMDQGESKKFEAAYLPLTDEPRRRKELTKITTSPLLDKYRVPFFYGLVTFEHEFLGIDGYVSNHLEKFSRGNQEVLEHLALVTIYSNLGLPLSLIQSLVGLDTRTPVTLVDIFGEGPAGLLISRAGLVRFMHQIIGEQVLMHLRGNRADDDWRWDLQTYATNFIKASAAVADSEALRPLFRQMFVDRVGRGHEGVEDRGEFAPIIETLDAINPTLGHSVLKTLADECPEDSHFWSHLGRHQVYRLGLDFDKAEEYLQKAISISRDDPLHHHTFGLVLRSRLRHELEALPEEAGIVAVFEGMNPLFEQAAAEFDETRRLSSDNVYGYITHVQLITLACRRLKDAAGEESIANVGLDHPEIDAWIAENVATAEQLLRDATHLYGTLDESNEYLTQCAADLDKLYGDLDSVVELWELADAAGRSSARGRRALANAYFARNGRKWTGMNPSELRRIVALMEETLRSSDRRDIDYQLWFNAYVLLPEFNAERALGQLGLWTQRFPNWRVFYYSYIVNFMLWFSRRTDKVTPFEVALEECRKLHVGRRNASNLWFGAGTGSFGLVPEDDLGSWKKDLNFFGSPEALTHVNGLVERISGPQAGSLTIDGQVSAFFVPGKTFSAHRNENDKVHFYLGFSPTGLRAWSVQPGHVPGGDRVRPAVAPAGSAASPIRERKAPAGEKAERARELRRDRVVRFARDFVDAAGRLGTQISVRELLQRVEAVLRVDAEAFERDFGELAKMLTESGHYESYPDGDNIYVKPTEERRVSPTEGKSSVDVRIFGSTAAYNKERKFGYILGSDGVRYWFWHAFVLPEFREKIGRPRLPVLFKPTAGEKGPIASAITLVEDIVLTDAGPIAKKDLPHAVASFVIQLIGKGPLPFKDVVREVRGTFRSWKPLESHLGIGKLGGFLADIDGLEVAKRDGVNIMRVSERPVFGRLPPGRRAAKAAAKDKPSSPPVDDADFQGVSRTIQETVVRIGTRQERPQRSSRDRRSSQVPDRGQAAGPTELGAKKKKKKKGWEPWWKRRKRKGGDTPPPAS